MGTTAGVWTYTIAVYTQPPNRVESWHSATTGLPLITFLSVSSYKTVTWWQVFCGLELIGVLTHFQWQHISPFHLLTIKPLYICFLNHYPRNGIRAGAGLVEVGWAGGRSCTWPIMLLKPPMIGWGRSRSATYLTNPPAKSQPKAGNTLCSRTDGLHGDDHPGEQGFCRSRMGKIWRLFPETSGYYREWSQINPSLYSICFTGCAQVQSRCELCMSVAHPMKRCALVANPDPELPARIKAVESAVVSLAAQHSNDPAKFEFPQFKPKLWKGTAICRGYLLLEEENSYLESSSEWYRDSLSIYSLPSAYLVWVCYIFASLFYFFYFFTLYIHSLFIFCICLTTFLLFPTFLLFVICLHYIFVWYS